MPPCVQVQLADGTTLPPLDFASCSGHGQCVDNGTALARCVCDDGWTGAGDLIGPALVHVDCHLSIPLMQALWAVALLQAVVALATSVRVQRALYCTKRKTSLCHKSRVYLTLSQVALTTAALGFAAICIIKLVNPERALGDDLVMNVVEVPSLMMLTVGLFAWVLHLCAFMLKQAATFKGVKSTVSLRRVLALAFVLTPLTMIGFSCDALMVLFPMHSRLLASLNMVFSGAGVWAFTAWVMLPLVVRPMAAELQRVLDLHEKQLRSRQSSRDPAFEESPEVAQMRVFRRKCLIFMWVCQGLTILQLALAVAVTVHPVGFFYFGIVHALSQINATGAITNVQLVLLQERQSTATRSARSRASKVCTPPMEPSEKSASSKLSEKASSRVTLGAKVCDDGE